MAALSVATSTEWKALLMVGTMVRKKVAPMAATMVVQLDIHSVEMMAASMVVKLAASKAVCLVACLAVLTVDL